MVRDRWLIVLVFCCLSSRGWSQFDQLASSKQVPQAQSQQELDEYIEVVYAGTPKEEIQLIEAFINHYPESSFQGIVYQRLMRAYQDLGNYQGLVESGESALRFQPDNLNTLLTLADAIPNGVSGNGAADRLRLAQAEQYAHRVFEGIERIQLPRSVSPERWQTLRRQMEASAHEALGHIASKRGDLQQAVAEFEKAVSQNPTPRGSQFYRLGVAYMLVGKDEAARTALRRAAELGPEEIRHLATPVLEKMKERRGQ